MLRLSGLFAALILASVTGLAAQEVRITPEIVSRNFAINGQSISIARNQDNTNVLTGDFAKTSRACPPFCIQPMVVAAGVETIGELEVMDFLEQSVAGGTGLLVDSRVPEWFARGTIPGAVNVPFLTLDPANPYRDDLLNAIGARQGASGWDFSGAYDLVLFCNGPWCEQSPRAIKSLLETGYPASKMHYYRGGMQDWLLLGLTVQQP